MAKPQQDKGAVATAERLEHHERAAEQKVLEINEQIDALAGLIEPNMPEEARQPLQAQLSALQRQSFDQYKIWFELTKQVREFYKSVDATKREGEKLTRADVETFLTNTWRFQRIGREKFIISIAQDALHCKDEQDFYEKYADLIRACELDTLKTAFEHEKFPEWVTKCYENAL